MLNAAKLMFGLEEARPQDFSHDNLILYNSSTHRKPRTTLEKLRENLVQTYNNPRVNLEKSLSKLREI